MKKLIYLIVLVLILGLVLTGCSLLTNVGQVPNSEQSGITYLTKALPLTSLVGLWHFDEGAGDTAYDSSVNSNHGTLTNMNTANCWVLGKFGNALSFDGTDDYVQIANESNFDFEKTDALTLEAWVKTSSDACLNIITKMQNASPNTGYQLIKHDSIRGNVLYFFLINNFATSNMIRAYGSTNIADGQWHHVAVTYNGSSNVSGVKIYVDGEPETMSWSHNNLTSSILNGLPLQISGREGSNYAFSGLIDEVRIWDIALTAGEIAYNYVLGDVTIDIKPGSDPNSINLGSNGVVPVAILGSAIFDASTVDPFTVKLADATVKIKGNSGNAGSLEDVNDDGYLDLVVQVYTSQIVVQPGEVELLLTAYTYDDLPIIGRDWIRIVPQE